MEAEQYVASGKNTDDREVLHEISNDKMFDIGNELLAITSNAVKSLNGQTSHQSNQYGELQLLSPVHIHSPELDVTSESKLGECLQLNLNNNARTINPNNKSTKRPASRQNSRASSVQNSSMSSGHSVSSQRSSLLSGNAKRVKISAKKLREIQSPFDRTAESVKIDTIQSKSGNVGGRKSSVSSQNSSRSTPSPRDPIHKTTQQGIEIDATESGSRDHSFVLEKHMGGNGRGDVSMKEVTRKPSTEGSGSEGSENMKIRVVREPIDSGYLTLKTGTRSANSTQEDVPSIHDEEENIKGEGVDVNPTVMLSPDPVDIVTCGGNNRNAQHDVSSSSYSPPESINSAREMLISKKSAFPSCTTLRQGALTKSVGREAETKQPEVMVHKTMLTTPQRHLKEKFVKRQVHGPHKRVVQSVLVNYTKETAAQEAPAAVVSQATTAKDNMEDMTRTAAMVAASAVAATQPYLQGIEMRLNELSEKMRSYREDSPLRYPGPSEEKMRELDREIQALTMERLNVIETQQTHLMSMYQKPYMYAPATVEKATSPGEALLSTPAPRGKAPQPSYRTPEQEALLERLLRHDDGQFTPDKREPSSLRREVSDLRREINHMAADAKHWGAGGRRTSEPAVSGGGGGGGSCGISKHQQHQYIHERPVRDTASPISTRHYPQPQKPSHQERHMQTPRASSPISKMHQQPAPIDEYLKKPANLPATSPYPTRVIKLPQPLTDTERDIMEGTETLRDVQQKYRTLQENLRIVQSKHNFMEYTGEDTEDERARMAKLVESEIAKIMKDQPYEVQAELLRLAEKEREQREEEQWLNQNLNPVQKKPSGKQLRPATGLSKGKIASRTDSGLGTHVMGKENKPKFQPSLATRPASASRLSRPVTRAPPKQPLRPSSARLATNKNPPAAITTTRSQPPITRGPILKKSPPAKPRGVTFDQPVKQAVKQQAAQQYPQQWAAQPFYGNLDGTGTMVPLSISLGPPVQSGRSHPITTRFPSPTRGQRTPSPHHSPIRGSPVRGRRSPSPRLSSTPVMRGGVTQQRPSDIEPHKSASSVSDQQKNNNNQQQQQQRNNNNQRNGTSSSSSSSASSSSKKSSSKKTSSKKEQSKEQEKDGDNQEEVSAIISGSLDHMADDVYDEDFEPEEEDEVQIPGYAPPPQAAYHGPAFPPQAPVYREDALYEQAMPDAETIAKNIKYHDELHDHAIKWVEEEIMARYIVDVYAKEQLAKDQQTAKAEANVMVEDKLRKRRARDEEESDDEDADTVSSEPSTHDSLAGVLGNSGLQMFIDAGAPVNDALIRELVEDGLRDIVRGMLGKGELKAGGRKDGEMPASPSRSKPRAAARPQRQPTPPLNLQLHRSPVVTPERTPRGSPVYSSPLGSSTSQPPPAPKTPDLTPQSSIALDINPPPHKKSSANLFNQPPSAPSGVVPLTPAPSQQALPVQVVKVVQREVEVQVGGGLEEIVEPEPETETEESSHGETAYKNAVAKYGLSATQITAQDSTQYEDMTGMETPEVTPPASPKPPAREATPPPKSPEPEPEPKPASPEPVVEESVDEEPEPWGDPESPVQEAVPELPPRTETPPPLPPREPLPSPPHTPEPAPSESHAASSTYTETDLDETSYTTNPDHVSEGQWLVSIRSEGELPLDDIHSTAAFAHRMQTAQMIALSQQQQQPSRMRRSDDTTFNDLSEGEVRDGQIGGAGAQQIIIGAGKRCSVNDSSDLSLGEVRFGKPSKQASVEERNMSPSRSRPQLKKKGSQERIVSPMSKGPPSPAGGFVLRVRPRDNDDEDEHDGPQHREQDQHEDEYEDDFEADAESPEQEQPPHKSHEVSHVDIPPTSPSKELPQQFPSTSQGQGRRGQGRPISSGGAGRVMSSSGPGLGGGAVGGGGPMARPRSSDQRPTTAESTLRDSLRDSTRGDSLRDSMGGLMTTGSEPSEDRINVQALMATRDYYNNTITLTTDEEEESSDNKSTSYKPSHRRGGGGMGASGTLESTGQQQITTTTFRSFIGRSSVGGGTGGFGSTLGSSMSDISLPPGLTHTMEKSASQDLSHERSTGEGEDAADEDLRRAHGDEAEEEEDRMPLQVSVTLPSMREEESEEEEEEEADSDDEEGTNEDEFHF